MALYDAAIGAWTEPVTLTHRSFVQVHSGWPVLVASGAPASPRDGGILRDEKGIIMGAGLTLRFRADGLVPAVVYVGRVE